MRTIKFRGKPQRGYDYTNGHGWVYGSLLSDGIESRIVSDEDLELYSNSDDDDFGYTPVVFKTVGQFTGLLDKNGKECFEGDILDNLEIVVFAQGAFMTSIGALAISIEHREVIGNIHES